MYDIIGDIHGFGSKLEELLVKLDYTLKGGYYGHKDRKAIFVGDYIDRGPEILKTLEIVKNMVDNGSAFAVMGNHEFNAIAYHLKRPADNEPLRSHNFDNIKQHKESVEQLSGDTVMSSWLDWFRKLPFSFEKNGLRVVHACWDPWAIDYLNKARERHGGVTDEFMFEALLEKKTEGPYDNLYWAIEWTLKGKELKLTDGIKFKDAAGKVRDALRVPWFGMRSGNKFSDYTFPKPEEINDTDRKLDADSFKSLKAMNMDAEDGIFYPKDAPPVVFGHYWIKPQYSEIQAPNVLCVDYSIAKKGKLCAYRWDPGVELDPARMVLV